MIGRLVDGRAPSREPAVLPYFYVDSIDAAVAHAEALPTPATDRQRLVFGRIQSLATKTSAQASASLGFANAQVAALTAHMDARRKAADR